MFHTPPPLTRASSNSAQPQRRIYLFSFLTDSEIQKVIAPSKTEKLIFRWHRDTFYVESGVHSLHFNELTVKKETKNEQNEDIALNPRIRLAFDNL